MTQPFKTHSEKVKASAAVRFVVLSAHALLGLLIGLTPAIFNHRFYLKDDMEHQFLPMFYHVGRQLRAGEFPFLTLTSWFGSNIVSELQFAIFNPVSLALNAILPSFTDYEVAAAFLACFYYMILLPGAYVLARSFSIDRGWASLIALCIAASNFLSYWGASNWFPLFSSFAWFVWAWAFLRLSLDGREQWLLATLFSYLTITIGFPYSILLLCVVTALHFWELLRSRKSFGRALMAVMPLAAALLLSAVPLLALVGVGSVSTRTAAAFNNGFMMPNLVDVLQISAPFHFGFLNLWHGYQPHQTPIYYAAWFLVPVLSLLNWRSVDWRQPAAFSLLFLAGLVVLAFQGPEEFSLLHFLLRWIPFLHTALLLLIGLWATQVGLTWSRGRIFLGLAILGLMHVTSWQLTPDRWLIILLSLSASLGAFTVATMIRSNNRLLLAWFGMTSLLFFGLTHAAIRENRAFTDVNFPRYSSGAADNFSAEAPESYEIVLGPAGYGTNVERAKEVVSGYIFYEQGKARINGYSAIGHQPLTDLLCMPWNGSTCPAAAQRLFEREPETSQAYIDLFRVDSIIAWKGEHLNALLPQLGSDWHLEHDGVYTQRFTRKLPELPGSSLAWVPAELDVSEQEASATISRAEFNVANHSSEEEAVVFARLWWPGYRAQLDGVELPVRAVAGIFAAVDIPEGASGQLSLVYRPPLFHIGLFFSTLGMLVIVAVLLLPAWRSGKNQVKWT